MAPQSRPGGRDPASRTYRTLPSRMAGWALAGAAVLLAVLLGRGAPPSEQLGTAAVAAAVLAVIWVVLLRPRVEVGPTGVVLRNLLTDTEVPFGALAEVTHVWALELVDAQGRTHSSWAVPARRQWRTRTAADDFAETTTTARSREGTHAVAVAGDLERALDRWRRDGRPGSGSPVRRSWAPGAVLPLGAAAALALLVALV